MTSTIGESKTSVPAQRGLTIGGTGVNYLVFEGLIWTCIQNPG